MRFALVTGALLLSCTSVSENPNGSAASCACSDDQVCDKDLGCVDCIPGVNVRVERNDAAPHSRRL